MNNEYLLDIILYSNKNNKNININNELERIKNICIIYEENKYKCVDYNKSNNNYIPSDTVIYKKNKVKNNVVSEETEIKIPIVVNKINNIAA